jgi:hypothetical protein
VSDGIEKENQAYFEQEGVAKDFVHIDGAVVVVVQDLGVECRVMRSCRVRDGFVSDECRESVEARVGRPEMLELIGSHKDLKACVA